MDLSDQIITVPIVASEVLGSSLEIETGKFLSQTSPMNFKMSWRFQLKRTFLLPDTKFSKMIVVLIHAVRFDFYERFDISKNGLPMGEI